MLVVMSVDPIYNDGAMSTSDIGADQKFVSVERRRDGSQLPKFEPMFLFPSSSEKSKGDI